MSISELRQKAKDTYKQLIETGHDISIAAFARDVERYLGQPVPFQTVRDWAQDDRWADIVAQATFDVTPELQRKKHLFDIAYADAMYAESPTDKAAMSRAFYNISKAIPSTMRPKVEHQILEVRENIYDYLQNEPDIPKPKKSSLYKTWIDLELLLLTESFAEDEDGDRIEADQIIMERRGEASNHTASG